MSQEKIIDAAALRTENAENVVSFLGFSASGTPVLVNADSMLIYRGMTPTKVNISIDDPALPMGIYAIDGSGLGTLPETTVGAAMLINWKPSNVSRTQIYVSYWSQKMFVRRRHSNVWEEWREIQTLSPS